MAGSRNQLRIVGGEFRSRRLHFPNAKGLRPTADRVRETLFNWLLGELKGVRVLDLFAGSGALGLEALSRGAAQATFVERSKPVAQQLQHNIGLLGLDACALVETNDASRFLKRRPAQPYDLVFLDPPFADRSLGRICVQLEEGGFLATPAWIYLEQDSSRDWPDTPGNWELHREGSAGQAAFRLMHRNG